MYVYILWRNTYICLYHIAESLPSFSPVSYYVNINSNICIFCTCTYIFLYYTAQLLPWEWSWYCGWYLRASGEKERKPDGESENSLRAHGIASSCTIACLWALCKKKKSERWHLQITKNLSKMVSDAVEDVCHRFSIHHIPRHRDWNPRFRCFILDPYYGTPCTALNWLSRDPLVIMTRSGASQAGGHYRMYLILSIFQIATGWWWLLLLL